MLLKNGIAPVNSKNSPAQRRPIVPSSNGNSI